MMFVLSQNDGLMRVNGDAVVQDTRESPVRPVSFSPKPASPNPPLVSEISAGSETPAEECTQTSSIQKPEHVKEEKDSHSGPVKMKTEDEASQTLSDSELAGWRLFALIRNIFLVLYDEVMSFNTQRERSSGFSQISDEFGFFILGNEPQRHISIIHLNQGCQYFCS